MNGIPHHGAVAGSAVGVRPWRGSLLLHQQLPVPDTNPVAVGLGGGGEGGGGAVGRGRGKL